MSNGNDKSLESWIWDAACSIRGAKDAPKFKDYSFGFTMLIYLNWLVMARKSTCAPLKVARLTESRHNECEMICTRQVRANLLEHTQYG